MLIRGVASFHKEGCLVFRGFRGISTIKQTQGQFEVATLQVHGHNTGVGVQGHFECVL